MPANTPSVIFDILRSAGLRPPKRLTLAVTGACNLRCAHCWVDAGVSSSAGHVPAPALRRTIEEFATLGGEELRLTGGEVLCHPHWKELLQLAHTLRFTRISIQSNGMLFHDEEAAALGQLDFPGLSLQISLDGATSAAHDLVRGEGAFAGAMNGISCLVRAGLAPRIILAFTEMRHNLEEIPAILALAENLGVGAVISGTLVRCGRSAEGSPVAPPEPDQYMLLLQNYDADPGFRRLYDRLGKIAAIEWRKGAASPSDRCTFVENPYLSPQGVLYPCVLCHNNDFAVSDVFGKTLSDAFAEGAPLWSELLRISRSRADRIPRCLGCPGQVVCAGGCMGRAWGSCGDLMATDDRCEARQAVYRHGRIGSESSTPSDRSD